MIPYDSLKLELGERSYNILIGTGLIKNAGDLIAPVLKQSRVVVVTDENVAPLYLPMLKQFPSQPALVTRISFYKRENRLNLSFISSELSTNYLTKRLNVAPP